MTDEELLIKYRKYKKRRNLIIMISFLFILIISLFIFNKLNNTKIDEKKEDQIIEEMDITPPILTLNEESIEITEGDEIDYKSYIESAIDDVDGDVTEKVLYFEIDSSKIGKSEIIYYVLDNSNNMTQTTLKVIVKEKPKEIVENKPIEEQKPSNNTNTIDDKKQPENKPETDKKIIKYFLFSEGYTMNNVVDACASELKKLNRAGSCTPLTDSSGIYLGMKLETN